MCNNGIGRSLKTSENCKCIEGFYEINKKDC